MKPVSPSHKPLNQPVPGPTGADAVHPSTDAHAVGDAAGAASATTAATGAGNSGSGGDWLDEMRLPASGAAAPESAPAEPKGVPVSTRTRGDQRRGKTVESKRGQY